MEMLRDLSREMRSHRVWRRLIDSGRSPERPAERERHSEPGEMEAIGSEMGSGMRTQLNATDFGLREGQALRLADVDRPGVYVAHGDCLYGPFRAVIEALMWYRSEVV